MPQLDPSSFASQLFWLTISFIVLYELLARFFLPRVQSIFEMRTRTIENDVNQAESMQSESRRVQDVYEKALAEARANSAAVIADMKDKIADVAANTQAELDKTLEKQLADSDAGIRKAKAEVMGKLVPVATEVAQKIVEIVADYKPERKEIEAAMRSTAKETAA